MNRKILLFLGICLLVATAAHADPCVVHINDDGSVTLPPKCCEYHSPHEIHVLLDDLPDGTVIHVKARHKRWFCNHHPDDTEQPCSEAGGQFGGQIERSSSTLQLDFSDDSGWRRTIYMPADFEVHTDQTFPQQQSIKTRMTDLDGTVKPNDVDFKKIKITAGSNTGSWGDGKTQIIPIPSPGSSMPTRAQFNSSFQLGGYLYIHGTDNGRLDGVNKSFGFHVEVVARAECDCE